MQITQVTKIFEIYSSRCLKLPSKPYHWSNINTYPPSIFDTFQIPKTIQRREDVFSRKATNHTSKGGTLTHSRLLLLSNYNKFNSENFHSIRNVTFSFVTFYLMQSFSQFLAWRGFCYSHIVGASLCTKTICNDNGNISNLIFFYLFCSIFFHLTSFITCALFIVLFY